MVVAFIGGYAKAAFGPDSLFLAVVALFRFKQKVIHVIAACAVVGLVVKTLQ